MDAASSGTSSLQYHESVNQKVAPILHPPVVTYAKGKRHCTGDASPGEFPLSAKPSLVLHVLTSCNLDPQDLAKLEATCSFFRLPANFHPDHELSLPELASLDMCEKRMVFQTMTVEQKQLLRQRCGGSWKLVLRYLLAGEGCSRREKSQTVAGPGHSIVVTSKGAVYTFGNNRLGQLGHETTDNEPHPRLIRSLLGIRIINASACSDRTMLVSDTGRVYALGLDLFGEVQHEDHKLTTTPRIVESLKDIFVVQAVFGNFFTAVLSREGRVYTFSWGDSEKLGHRSEPEDREPRPLLGALENTLVVQIAAGYCFLLALAFDSGRMSVYSVGCGLGGKLGNGTTTNEKQPRLIEQFKILNLEPIAIAAGSWHAAVLGKDGRVCTWGWGRSGCLGHGNEDNQAKPMVVEALSNIKAVYIAAGVYTTFVVSDNGNAYSFGSNVSNNLGHNTDGADHNDDDDVDDDDDDEDDEEEERQVSILSPTLVASLKDLDEKIVQIGITSSIDSGGHTLALAESNKLYAFGYGAMGQLGVKLDANETMLSDPMQVNIDLS